MCRELNEKELTLVNKKLERLNRIDLGTGYIFIEVHQRGNFTFTKLVLATLDIFGVGFSKRNPRDGLSDSVGEAIAICRAVEDLASVVPNDEVIPF